MSYALPSRANYGVSAGGNLEEIDHNLLSHAEVINVSVPNRR